jgi:phospholipid/cholesterol/gamma-HCH transport system substrate-binding protein
MVKSIRELAEDFEKRSGALIADGRRTLSDISRAVNNFDRNPSRVIFGGSNNAAPAEPASTAAVPPRLAPAAPAAAAPPKPPSGQKKQ